MPEPGGQYAVGLDKRVIKTSKGNRLVLPSETLARQIAMEWEIQDKFVRPSTMHMTAVASTALDNAGDTEEQKEVKIDILAEYLATDTVCFRATTPAELAKRQRDLWDPLMGWYMDTNQVTLGVSENLVAPEHSPDALMKLKDRLRRMDPWEFTAYEIAVGVLHSEVITAAVMARRLSVGEAIATAYLEAEYQREIYGRCEDEDGLSMEDKTATLASAVLMHRFICQ